MKIVSTATLLAALSFSAATFAQSGDMGNMKMEGKGMQNCMDMKGMDAKNCQDMMKGMDAKGTAKPAKSMAHDADAVVKEFDVTQGKVTLAHGPVKSLGWPAMTMTFGVKDKTLFDKLSVGTKVHVGFKKEGDEYIVTSVK
ncbi:copper-binding protein [Comamonas thiooxydans]|uniref:copper-binding protein n=1 Tax=Comamonas thiooxydans TaxID=363952 RepID=UPI00050E7DA0|nr:copper-binding protein [Comamonas thiooxydans]KGH19333.1 hypothetical protein P606_23530 [Comamonas thiooxydans]